ncbi:MAG: MetQ/NlpA family ABC transporter substrate-binding protein [Bacilli bacterium]
MKKIITVLLLLFISVACSSTKKETSNKIIIGSKGSDAQIWNYIASLDATKEQGIEIEVKEISDGLVLNDTLASNEIDVNAFQSLAYLESYNKDSKKGLIPFASTYIEPNGLYSKKYDSLTQIKEGSTIGISNNPAGQVRALRLLEKAELISLNEDFDLAIGTIKDIKDNKLNLKFQEIEDNSGPRLLDDLDLVVIGNTIAMEAGLKVLQDAIYYEEVSKENRLIVNVLVTNKENKDNENIKKLNDLYHLPEVQAYISEQFDGSKVEVLIPISELVQ